PDMDEAAGAARQHVSCDRLRDEERAAQVRVEHEVPVGPRDIGRLLAHVAAGVVDEDVDLAERLVRGVRHLPDAGFIVHIQRQRNGAASHRFDLALKRAQRFERPAGDRHIGAGVCERSRERLPEAAAGARDDRDAPAQIEKGAQGCRITFISLPPPLCSRSNQVGPSSSGAVTLMSGATSTAPRASRSRQAGYSPLDAHDPRSDTSRVTISCSGSSTRGATFPISTTVPPLRTLRAAARNVSGRPTTSNTRFAPFPPLAARTAAGTSSLPSTVQAAPSRVASARRSSSTSTAITCWKP